MLEKQSFIPTITAKALSAGDTVGGWFWASFRGIQQERIGMEHPEVKVSFDDALSGNTHVMSMTPQHQGVRLPGEAPN